MVSGKGMVQGLLDEEEFLQNHLRLLDLDEVSEELPHRGAEIRQHSQDGLHHTADGLQEGHRLLPRRTDAKAETAVLWPPHAKSCFIGKDPDAGRDCV